MGWKRRSALGAKEAPGKLTEGLSEGAADAGACGEWLKRTGCRLKAVCPGEDEDGWIGRGPGEARGKKFWAPSLFPCPAVRCPYQCLPSVAPLVAGGLLHR